MDDSEMCPVCKTTKYNKPSMKLMINVCGHVICETCMEQTFFRGSAPCPNAKCGRVLKKNEFRDKIFDDAYIEKEVAIRKKYVKDLIKTEHEFPSLREFNDYLEMIETLMFNLANNLEEEETIKKIEDLKKEVKESSKNRVRLMMENPKRENPLFTYKPYTIFTHGPSLPSIPDILHKYVPNVPTNMTQLASGYPPHLPVNRLLLDAFSDLYLTVRPYPADQT